MNLSISKYLRALSAAIAIIAVLVCFVPLPKRINVTFQSSAYTKISLEYIGQREFTVKGWFFDYLLKNDELQGKVELEGFEGITEIDSMAWYFKDLRVVSHSFYSAEKNEAVDVRLVDDSDFSNVCMTVDNTVYLASRVGENEDSLMLLFKDFLD